MEGGRHIAHVFVGVMGSGWGGEMEYRDTKALEGEVRSNAGRILGEHRRSLAAHARLAGQRAWYK